MATRIGTETVNQPQALPGLPTPEDVAKLPDNAIRGVYVGLDDVLEMAERRSDPFSKQAAAEASVVMKAIVQEAEKRAKLTGKTSTQWLIGS